MKRNEAYGQQERGTAKAKNDKPGCATRPLRFMHAPWMIRAHIHTVSANHITSSLRNSSCATQLSAFRKPQNAKDPPYFQLNFRMSARCNVARNVVVSSLLQWESMTEALQLR